MFEELAREGPAADELDKARRRIVWDMQAMGDSAEDTAAFYASSALFERVSTPAQEIEELVRVEADQVREAARVIARPERLDVVAVGLLEDGEDERLTDAVKGWEGAR
jgi:predicted Zn-dependent peptidase